MGKYKISVVVPVYKAENFLRMCVDSILQQTLKDVEIVLVDDGSPDRSGQICDEYAAQHQNVMVIHQENGGINKARYAGVKKATSDWITFADNDDTLPLDALERLYAQTENTELVIGSFVNLEVDENLSLEQYRQGVIDSTLIPPQPWGKLYRKELFSENTFDFPREIDGAEDMIMSIRILFSLTRPPHFVKKSVYHFMRHTSSASHTIKKTLDYEYLFDDCRVNSIPQEQRERYMESILRNRINGLIGVAVNFPQDVAKKGHPFFDRINADIKRYHYKTNLREYLLLHSHSPFLMKGIAYQRMMSLLREGFFDIGFRFMFWFRLQRLPSPFNLLPRLICKTMSLRHHIDIERGTKIGYGFKIMHGGPVVINVSAKIGNNVNIGQFTTIGSLSLNAATIGDNVYIGPSVCIVENVNIGNNVTIGAGAVVVKDIPEDCTAAGNPAKIISMKTPGRFIWRRWEVD